LHGTESENGDLVQWRLRLTLNRERISPIARVSSLAGPFGRNADTPDRVAGRGIAPEWEWIARMKFGCRSLLRAFFFGWLSWRVPDPSNQAHPERPVVLVAIRRQQRAGRLGGRNLRLAYRRAARRHGFQDGVHHRALRRVPGPRWQVAVEGMALQRQGRRLR